MQIEVALPSKYSTIIIMDFAKRGTFNRNIFCMKLIINYSKRKEYFCQEFIPVTFMQGTLLAPLLILFILYTPTTIYLIKKSYDKFGKKNFFEYFFDNIVIFIFPLATNISFYNVIPRNRHDVKRNKGMEKDNINQSSKYIRRTRSLEICHPPSNESEVIKRNSTSCHLFVWDNKKQKPSFYSDNVPHFSLHQSNVLYFFFFVAAFIILFIEMYVQVSRGESSFKDWFLADEWGMIAQIVSSILLFNLMLWLDFNREFRKDQNERRKLFSIYKWIPSFSIIWCYTYLRYNHR